MGSRHLLAPHTKTTLLYSLHHLHTRHSLLVTPLTATLLMGIYSHRHHFYNYHPSSLAPPTILCFSPTEMEMAHALAIKVRLLLAFFLSHCCFLHLYSNLHAIISESFQDVSSAVNAVVTLAMYVSFPLLRLPPLQQKDRQ